MTAACSLVGAAPSHPKPAAEENAEEEFYESLDRILSSSCSSTSASDDDSSSTNPAADHFRRRRRFAAQNSAGGGFFFFPPPPPSSSDVWTSEPASVAERRRHLLQRLGLASDPAFAHLMPAGDDEVDRAAPPGEEAELGRSGYGPRPNPSARARSQSVGVNSSTLLSDYRHCHQTSADNFQVATKLSRGFARSRPWSAGNIEVSDGEATSGSSCGAAVPVGEDSEGFCDNQHCLIKNLDDGKEFVVKDFLEDGTWDKLREVETGRQLTMEEFEMSVGRSPIVQELMRRRSVTGYANSGDSGGPGGGESRSNAVPSGQGMKPKTRASWYNRIRNVAGTVVAGGHHRERRSSDERDTSSEKGGRRSSSATDDSQDGSYGLQHGLERIKVRQYGKSHKELTGLYMIQEIPAHTGSIWTIKFSLDGRYLASAGEDRVIHVWEVREINGKVNLLNERPSKGNKFTNPFVVATCNGSPESTLALASAEESHCEKKQWAKVPASRKSIGSEPLMVPENLFALSEKPICSFQGHLDNVLDLSWSKSQHLLSSSMDKMVRLWHMSSNSCLKTFSHTHYVTCVQFNPVDDRYFISGSLDEKVRIWSIPDRQIVDWDDLHEMVTAACYTPDGEGALVGSHDGSCHLYDTSENRLLQRSNVDLENRKKKSKHKKITGFQFAPGNMSKVLLTSADSRIRVIDGKEMVQKFKGFRNTGSQISAYCSHNGKHVISASEDSHVYVWRWDDNSRQSRSKGANVTCSYEHFYCQDVTVAVPWPRSSGELGKAPFNKQNGLEVDHQVDIHSMVETSNSPTYQENNCQPHSSILNANSNLISDRVSATWPEELVTTNKHSPRTRADFSHGDVAAQTQSAWGFVIVTAGRDGAIRAFQNFGFPIRI